MMRLAELAEVCGTSAILGADLPIGDLAFDSRSVTPGSLFFCLPGEKTDGHRFIPQARDAGAAAFCVERSDSLLPGMSGFVVPDAREAMALAAAAFFGYPAARLRLTGVTGTNGKTTTVHLIERMLSLSGRRSGLLGTIGNRLGEDVYPSLHTTPESLDLQRWLGRAADAGLQDVCMEVSSHALAQQRVRECHFDVSVFTNCTQDHLDYHGTMEAYAAAKTSLFTDHAAASMAAKGRVVSVINVDDPVGRDIAARATGEVLRYSLLEVSDIYAEDLDVLPSGSRFALTTPSWRRQVDCGLVGLFNVYNSLAAAGAAYALGVEADCIAAALEEARPVPGRMEPVEAGQPFAVVVDYAHTPDGLEKVLSSLAAGRGEGRLITVFGCGGDRDRRKRPLMGEVVSRLADLAIVTSDNPRSEEPGAIIEEIIPGMKGPAELVVEPDRRRAIEAAVRAAASGDMVLIAGKGHEDYQIIGDEKLHFDDREEAAGAIRRLRGEERLADG